MQQWTVKAARMRDELRWRNCSLRHIRAAAFFSFIFLEAARLPQGCFFFVFFNADAKPCECKLPSQYCLLITSPEQIYMLRNTCPIIAAALCFQWSCGCYGFEPPQVASRRICGLLFTRLYFAFWQDSVRSHGGAFLIDKSVKPDRWMQSKAPLSLSVSAFVSTQLCSRGSPE